MLPKKIVYFIEFPFCKRDYERFGVGFFEEKGLDVEVWDFTPFLHPEVHAMVRPPDPIDYSRLRSFDKKREGMKAIASLPKGTLAIVLIGYALASLAIFRALSKYEISYLMLSVATMPFSLEEECVSGISSRWRQGTRLLSRAFAVFDKRRPLWRIAEWIFGLIPFRCLSVSPAKYLVAGGRKSINLSGFLINVCSRIIWGHSLDYDIFLRSLQEKDRPVLGDFILFLDEYFPFHPDFFRMGGRAPITSEHYYPLLSKYFDAVERMMGIPVVIAEHPRSDYGAHPDYFARRRRIRGKTAALIRDCRCVLLHSSTSMNFAVLFRKPMSFLTYGCLQGTLNGRAIDRCAAFFGKVPIDLETFEGVVSEEEMLCLRPATYELFEENFIGRADAPKIELWEIVLRHLHDDESGGAS